MHWTIDDVRALDQDELDTLLRLIREGKIKATVF
jgi:hypothetical protein